MTPREGAVAWGVRRGSDGAIVSVLMSHANAIRGAEEIAGVDLEDAYTPVPLYAHPAATAREEAIRAEVIEECARVCEEQRCRWCRDAGKTNPNHADCCACRDDAAAIRALALARGVEGGKP